MAYCSQCGKLVEPVHRFCAGCGSPQPVEPVQHADPLARMSPRTASILCYIPMLGWIASIVVLASDHFRHDPKVRFHAFQGLYIFVAWLIVDQVLGPMFRWMPRPFMRFDKLLEVLVFGSWIFMLFKASQEEAFALPIVGDLAQKSASGQ